MARYIPLEDDEANVVDQCEQALRTAVHSKFGCSVILHGMDAPSGHSSRRDSHLSLVELGQVTLHISKGHIEKQKTKIIVNSTGLDLDLSRGAVSNAILQEAGRSLQDEVSKYCQMCNFGDVLETKGYNLHSKFVYHVLCVPKGTRGSKTAQQILSDVISECLNKAKKDSCTSIAFPAIGCGVLNFRKSEVAGIMTEAVKQFSRSYMGSQMDVHFVIFPSDEDTFQAFAEKHASLQHSKLSASTSHMGNVDIIPIPSIEIRANSSEERRAAKRWINDVVNILRDNKTDHSMTNNYVQHFGPQENKDLMSLQDKFQVGLQVFFTDGQAGIKIMGTPSGVTAAVLEVEAMCCKVQAEPRFMKHARTAQNVTLLPYLAKPLQHIRGHPKQQRAVHPLSQQGKEPRFMKHAHRPTAQNHTLLPYLAKPLQHIRGHPKQQRAVHPLSQPGKGDTSVPDNWDDMTLNLRCQVFPLKNNSQEYVTVQNLFLQSCCNNTIVKIDRVQIPYLWKHYEIKKQAMEAKNGHKNNERQLFHGTSQPTINHINHNGFNRSYAGKNAAAYGNGTYFAVNARYSASNTYSVPDALGQKYMYLCRVLTGDFTTGRQGMIVPPAKTSTTADLYDTVTDNPGAPTMFVVFNDNQAYPEYLITFK
ncbi:protein mono-ADP-ribosyltransferase PARP14-like isoform X2 [Sardina pilchardus]|uniref:protein mono-ADP-ribosyltransferase PARP14-like isoform X2 n=1 Tax=Sardina pilchardus TaxID=27697 RepID=UPI002E1312E2